MEESHRTRSERPFVERRLGERHVVPPIPVQWRADARRRGLRRDGPDDAQIVNLSPIGAGIVAPHRRDVGEGSTVVVEWAGLRAEVEIRRIEGGPVPGQTYYGVRFGSRDDGFDDLVDGTLGAHRPSSVEAMRSHLDATPPVPPRA